MFDLVTDGGGDGVWGPAPEVGAAGGAVVGGKRLAALPRAAKRMGDAVEEEQSRAWYQKKHPRGCGRCVPTDLSNSAGHDQPVSYCVPTGNVAFPASQKVHFCVGGRLHSPALFPRLLRRRRRTCPAVLPIGSSSKPVAALYAISVTCSWGQNPP